MSGMAEVLAEHYLVQTVCTCGHINQRGIKENVRNQHARHQADALSAAGFGMVRTVPSPCQRCGSSYGKHDECGPPYPTRAVTVRGGE